MTLLNTKTFWAVKDLNGEGERVWLAWTSELREFEHAKLFKTEREARRFARLPRGGETANMDLRIVKFECTYTNGKKVR